MPEPTLRLALCLLYSGTPTKALQLLSTSLQRLRDLYDTSEPDPVEWAYLIVALLCAGHFRTAVERVNQFKDLEHPELENARTLIRLLGGKLSPRGPRRSESTRYSVHRLPNRGIDEWLREICLMLHACGQSALAEFLMQNNCAGSDSCQEGSSNSSPLAKSSIVGERAVNLRTHERDGLVSFSRRALGSYSASLATRLARKTRKGVRTVLHNLELKLGYFLPYRFSTMKRDECFSEVRQLVGKEHITSALIIGAAPGEG